MTDTNALMAGKRGLVMGVANERSIAWGIASTLSRHGAEMAFTFQGEALGKRVKPLAKSVGSSIVLPCDVADEPGSRQPATSRPSSTPSPSESASNGSEP